MMCIPDNGCCDIEVNVNGVKVRAGDAMISSEVAAVLKSEGCAILTGDPCG